MGTDESPSSHPVNVLNLAAMASRPRVEQDRAGNRFGAGPFASQHDQQLGVVSHCVGQQNVGPIHWEPAVRPWDWCCSGRLCRSGEEDILLLRDDGEERVVEGADGDWVHQSTIQDAEAARVWFLLWFYLFVCFDWISRMLMYLLNGWWYIEVFLWISHRIFDRSLILHTYCHILIFIV